MRMRNMRKLAPCKNFLLYGILQQTVQNQIAYANKIFFYLGCGCLLVKGQNLTFVYIPNHNVISKTTLVCTTVYNANTHSE